MIYIIMYQRRWTLAVTSCRQLIPAELLLFLSLTSTRVLIVELLTREKRKLLSNSVACLLEGCSHVWSRCDLTWNKFIVQQFLCLLYTHYYLVLCFHCVLKWILTALLPSHLKPGNGLKQMDGPVDTNPLYEVMELACVCAALLPCHSWLTDWPT